MLKAGLMIILLAFSLPIINGQTLTLTFAGDIMAHDVNIFRDNGYYVYKAITNILQASDFNFANFETPIYEAVRPQTYPFFNVHREYAERAIKAGFNVFSLANNHSLDHGRAGVLATMTAWQQLHEQHPQIAYSGLRGANTPWQVTTLNKNGIRLAFIAFTQFINLPQSGSSEGQEHINIISLTRADERERLITVLQEARHNHDVVIFSYHGGEEYVRTIEERKNNFFKELIDKAGVDIIWGHHPHVLQPYQYHNGKLIINSSGNLISGQTWGLTSGNYTREWAFTGDSALYQVYIGFDQGELTLSVRLIPISNYRHPQHGMVIILLDEPNSIFTDMSEAWLNYFIRRREHLDYLLKATS
ncbi:MAG: CapA family protein [Spirochaetaceae bacterium]|nr:CapA family protein [Spirochaetaceae bacterium]